MPQADALGEFRCQQRRAAAEERIVNQLAAFRVVENRPAHQLDAASALDGRISLRPSRP